jgi:hypothetical protein
MKNKRRIIKNEDKIIDAVIKNNNKDLQAVYMKDGKKQCQPLQQMIGEKVLIDKTLTCVNYPLDKVDQIM